MRSTLRTLLALALALAGCSDPQGPCDRPGACEFEGVHLEIAAQLAETAGTDPVDGMPRVWPADLRIDVVVVNRGDSTSAPVQFDAGAAWFGMVDTVPALRPGERWRVQIELVPNSPAYVLRGGDTLQVHAGITTLAEIQEPVAHTATETFHLLVPTAHIEVASSRDSLTFGHPTALILRVTNSSRVVPLPPDTLFLGLAELDLIFPAWPDGVVLPGLAPGSSMENAYLVAVPADGGSLDETLSYSIVACLGSRDVGDRTFVDFWGACGWSEELVEGVPDLSRCTQATAVPGVLVPTVATCTGWRDRAYWALDVQAGYRYVMDREVGIHAQDGSAYDWNGSGWVAPFTGRVYLVESFPGSSPALRVDEFHPAAEPSRLPGTHPALQVDELPPGS